MRLDQQTELTLGNIGTALIIGTIALLMLGLQPIVLGELVEQRVISLESVGLVAMGEIIALGLGVFLGDAVMPLTRIRPIIAIAALLTAGFDILTVFTTGDSEMIPVRMAAGLCEGILVWSTTSIIVRTANPERLGGIFFVIQTLSQASVGATLALALIPSYGWQGSFVLLALLSLLPCLLIVRQPARLAPFASKETSGFAWSVGTLLPLVIVFFQLCAIGSLWAYLEPLGKAVGMDAVMAQTLVSGVLVMQVLGGVAATLLVRALPSVVALALGAIILAASAFYAYGLPVGSTTEFALACAVFGFTWLFILPFQIGLAFRADPTGRVGVLVPAMQLLGSAIGPLIASLTVEGDDASLVPMASSIFALLAVFLLLMWSRFFRRPPRSCAAEGVRSVAPRL